MPDSSKLQFLSEEDLTRIEGTARRLLDEVGIALEHTEGKEMLHGVGCRVEGGRVHIPSEVVDWTIDNVTPHRDFYNVDGSHAFRLDGQRPRFHNSGGQPFTRDLDTGRRRRANRQDIAEMSTLLDALPNVDIVIPMYSAQDVPGELLAVASTDAMLRHTRKPFSGFAIDRPEDVGYVVEMAAACCGGMEAYREHPTMYLSVSPVSPLRFTEAVTASIIAVVRSGTPFSSLPAPSLAATCPITLAGALAQQHAEILASFVIAAAANPGARVTYCSRISPIDLRSAVSSWGGPEVGIAGSCAAQLARRLGLSCDSYGFATSARSIDAQFGYERLTNALTPALGGVDILSGVASNDNLLVGSPEIAVIDNELIDLLLHIQRGCPTDDETLAFEVAREVIGGDGIFLAEQHTVDHMRRGALFVPTVSERAGSSGQRGEGVAARALARAREILATHQVAPLPQGVTAQLDEIMAEARRALLD